MFRAFWGFLVFIGIFLCISTEVFHIHYRAFYQRFIYLGPDNIFLALMVFLFIVYLIRIIKNNTFIGQNQLLNSFKEVWPKAMKVLPIVAPVFIALIIILTPAIILGGYVGLFFSCCIVFLAAPFIIMVPLGMILSESPFEDSLIFSFKLTQARYLKILYCLFALIIMHIAILIPFGIFIFLFEYITFSHKELNILPFLGVIILFLYVVMFVYNLCYFVELYMCLVEKDRPEDLVEKVQIPLESPKKKNKNKVLKRKRLPILWPFATKDIRPLGEKCKKTKYFKQDSTTENLHPLGDDLKETDAYYIQDSETEGLHLLGEDDNEHEDKNNGENKK